MLRNMATSLLQHEQIKTTMSKAKEASRFTDTILTKAKGGGLTARREVARYIQDAGVQKKIFDVLVPRYAQRLGGYTRVLRLGLRPSDNASLALVKLVV